jgi:hypothetical protein
MKIAAELKLNDDEAAQLAGILAIKPKELDAAFSGFAAAALEEYVRMFLGQKVFTRGSDIREYRLFLLIRSAFGNTIPDEQMVCALFQCTQAQSRTLLRAVMSKYQYELSAAIEASLKKAVESVHKNANGVFVVTVKSENLVGELNKILASTADAQDEVLRLAGKLATYELMPAAYAALCKRFGVKQKD